MPIQIQVFSDVICPWCLIGKRRLERALDATGERAEAQVTWLPYELNPDMAPAGMPRAEYRARKFGQERAEMLDREMTERGREEGISFRFDRIAVTPSTRKAHRLISFADREGRSGALNEALMVGYFEEARDIGTEEVLLDIAAAQGLDRDLARAALQDPEVDREVAALERRAAEIGITGVPFFILDGRFAVSGAQPAESWIDVLRDRASSGLSETA
ncbi:DsbA family oxidoreductase [Enterovirga sp.]|jgi:predicted DsbA family dithiol-disulfide isomerase|uniref:DsbA family oxidoreductase n=1 Tax=Enterovirga sp. TaxID=2026350 RepID=UPI002619271B|nr:DsbA family oxidoreductase [Enterovirga sp.]MDB5590057.1 oxidoreductase [Enterovirga sp.]